jgi:glycosyltransferase involved in cell wall biosynthesis
MEVTDLSEKKIALAFVGSVVLDEPRFHTTAFTRSGNLCQTNLITSIREAGIEVTAVIGFLPIQSWPLGRTVAVKAQRFRLQDGTIVDLTGFVNILLLKHLTIGLGTFRRLLSWGWRNRHVKARVVSTYNLSVPSGAFTLLAARLIGAKAVAYLYDINVPGETVSNSLLNRLDYKLQCWLMPRFDGLVVVSDAIVRDFKLHQPFVRVEGGVSSSAAAAIHSLRNPECFIIVSAGTLNEANGVTILLQAFSLLKGSHFRLRIAGKGPLEKDVRDAAVCDSRIEYCGFLTFDEVLHLYQSADVLVNLRLTKAMKTEYLFPSKLMEYLVSGRPVISTSTGHVESEYGEFLYLLHEETAEGLAAVLRTVERDSEAAEAKALAARDYMLVHKTWLAQGLRVKGLIDSIVTGNQRVAHLRKHI